MHSRLGQSANLGGCGEFGVSACSDLEANSKGWATFKIKITGSRVFLDGISLPFSFLSF